MTVLTSVYLGLSEQETVALLREEGLLKESPASGTKATVDVRPYVRDGHPVSGYHRHQEAWAHNAFEVKGSPDFQKIAARVLAAVEQSHPPGRLVDDDKYSITMRDMERNQMGSPAAGNYSSGDIVIDRNQPHVDQAHFLAHEIGHAVDDRVGEGDTGADGYWPPEFAPLMEAIKESAAAKLLRKQGRAKGGEVEIERNGKKVAVSMNAAFIRNYLTKPGELFARAYAQYVSEKSGDPVLMETVRTDGEGYLRYLWDAADFAPILQAFDAYFNGPHWNRA